MTIKGKRTKRAHPNSPVALTMSASASAGSDDGGRVGMSASSTTTNNVTGTIATTIATTEEEEDMAHCLILLAQGGSKVQQPPHHNHHQQESPAVRSTAAATAAATVGVGVYLYECKTCNRCFPSFQALGGHRASHKKSKLPATMALSLSDDHQQQQGYLHLGENDKNNDIEEVGLSLQIACNSSNTMSANNKLKVHACAICGAEFSSGQALGGHMRRHRPLIATGSSSPDAQSASPQAPPRNMLCLDLNLPADEQEDQQQQPQPQSPNLMFATNEKNLVFAHSLVDCHY